MFPWRRRRGSIFDLFDALMESVLRDIESFEEEFERLWREAAERGEIEVKKYGPYVYGFSITIGPDGKPIIREFGNIKRGLEGPVVKEEYEPFVDVFEDDEKVTIIAELPGVSKDKIKVRVNEDEVEIEATNSKKYHKVIRLPAKVKPETAKANYKNGVLEITIEKKEKKEKKKGVEIKPE